MASQGPLSPATVASVGTGDVAWTNPGNAAAQDDTYALATLATGQITKALRGEDFGFSIPSDATITGIVGEFEKIQSTGIDLDATDHIIRLAFGVVDSANKATGTSWPTSDTDTYDSYGSSSDIWGFASATPADVNATNFYFSIRAIATGANGATVSVDHMRLTVYYNPAPDAGEMAAMHNQSSFVPPRPRWSEIDAVQPF